MSETLPQAPADTTTAPPPDALNTSDTTATPSAPAQSLLQNLDAAEELWKWKTGLRTFVVVVGIIGIGCAAWGVASSPKGPYAHQLDDSWALVWSLLTFGVSVIWCTICILVLLLRRPNAPVHPGVAVGLDLILWLAFIPTALFALMSAVSVLSWASRGAIGQYTPYGEYTQAPNGTWVWNQSEYDEYVGRTRKCGVGDYKMYDGYGFNSCAEEDEYVNALWRSKGHRAGVEMTTAVCQFIALLLHFVLFVWACVDTHRRNRRRTNKDAEKLAADIVMKMIRNGAVVPGQNQSSMQQPLLQHPQPQGPPQIMPQQAQGWYAPMGHPQQPQSWPLAAAYQNPQASYTPMGMVSPPPVVLGPEKGESSRFA